MRYALLLAAGLVLLVLLEPHLFRFAVKKTVLFEAARHGVPLLIGTVEGHLFKPLTFREVQFATSRAAVVSKVSIRSATAAFSWQALARQWGHGFFDRLTLDGVSSDVTFQPYARETAAAHGAKESQPWLPAPSQAEVFNSGFVFHLGKRTVTFADVRFTVSTSRPGVIAIEKLTFESNHRFSRSFSVLRGTTALQGARWRVADLTLSDGVVLNSLSCDLDDVARGILQVEFDFAAFGGSLRGEVLNTSEAGLPLYEVAGQFSNISVEALGKFLRAPEQTGGTIKEGRFSFRGSLHSLDNATLSTRFEAADFRWGKRQWNSLTLGATVVNRRVQIPEFQLQQAHNTLQLKGDLALPGEETPWWLSDFSFDIAARIQNLTELSALLGPQFADTAGKVTIDGAIRGEGKSYTGQLLVAGNKLSWRGVPFDALNAGIKLDGNELQVVNLEAVRGTDFVRGNGSVNILGERRYQGELNASIEELAVYAPLLQKPVVPAPLAGGLVVNWSGDGTTGVHSGAFTAHCNKLRTPGTPEIPATLPIDADLEGTYAPGVLSVNKCILANGETRLEGRLAADATTVKLDALKLTQGKAPWFEGDATLPFNLFQWWVHPGPAALAPDAPLKARLTAKGVQLEEVAHLTGRPLPIRGLLSGTLKTESTLRNLFMTGALKLTNGQIPATEWLPALDKVEAEADIDGNVLRFGKLAARTPWGDLSSTGSLDLSRFDAPAFDLLLHGEKLRVQAGPQWAGSATLDVALTGTRENAAVTGAAQITALETAPKPSFGALIITGNPETIRVAAPAITLKPPFDRWTYRVTAATREPLKLKEGTVSADLRFTGSGTPLAATGSITFTGLNASTTFALGKLDKGTWYLGNGANDPGYVVARVSGRLLGQTSTPKYEGMYFGTPAKIGSAFWGEDPADDALIQAALTPGAQPLPEGTATLPLDLSPLDSYNPQPPADSGAQPATSPAPQPEAQPAASPGTPNAMP
ncbi:MAG: hypothetical protein PHQ12_04800 [Chthoniobacteraceae bacterium]|nr:hypothetical protein [Chthoniobacteraceae bacterium]